MNDKPFAIGISKAPKDPEKKKIWVDDMVRIQVSMWVQDGATCAECGHKYTSVEDFMRCNPVRGHSEHMSFVCGSCYPIYKTKVLPWNTKEKECQP